MWYPPKYHRTMQKSGLRMVCGVPHTPTHTVRHGSLHSDPTKLDMGPRTSIPPSHGWLQWVARLGHRAGRDSLPASLVAFQLGTAAADRPGAALPGRPWVPPLQSLLGAPPLTTPTPSNLQPSPPLLPLPQPLVALVVDYISETTFSRKALGEVCGRTCLFSHRPG